MNDRDTAFLKAAVENQLLTPEQAEQVLASLEKRAAIGVDRSAPEVAQELGLLRADQVSSLEQALRAVLPPERVAGFEIIEVIGRGAVGTVYRARQLSLDKVVALKVLHSSLSSRPQFVEQFVREAKTAGRIDHPHVVRAIDAGEADGYHYLAMELIEGRSLKERVAKDGPLTEQQALDLARAVAQGLAHAHGHGLLHRDLKPDNILVGDDGQVRIADLGLAVPAGDAELMSVEHRRMGTPFYISPEQARGEAVSKASELYSLGATLTFALTGRPPFTGKTVEEILTHHARTSPPSVRETHPEVSLETAELVAQLLEKDPSKRIASAREFIERLDAVERTLRDRGAAPRAAAPRRRPKGAQKPSVGGSAPAARSKRASGAAPAPRRAKAPEGVATPRSTSAAGSRSQGSRQRRTAAPLPQRPRASAPSAPPLTEPASREFTRKQRNVFTICGAVGGVVVSLIFLLLAVQRNQQADEEKSTTRVARSEKNLQAAIDKRIREWRSFEKDVETVKKRLPELERSAKSGRLRVEALWNILSQYPDSPAAPLIMERIDVLRGESQKSRFAGVQPFLDEAQKLREEGRLMDAIEKLTRIPVKLTRDKKVDEMVQVRVQELSDQIDLDYKSDIHQVQEHVKAQRYDAAIALLEKIIRYADEDRVRDARLRVEQLQKDKATLARAEAERRRQEEMKQYTALVDEYKSLCERRNFKECISRAVTLETTSTTAEVKKLIETDLRAFEALDRFIKDAVAYLEKQSTEGKELTFEKRDGSKVVGQVAEVRRKGGRYTIVVTVSAGGGKAGVYVELDEVTDPVLFSWVEALQGPRAAAYLVPLGVLFTYRQMYSLAERHFELAQQHGISPTAFVERLEWAKSHAG